MTVDWLMTGQKTIDVTSIGAANMDTIAQVEEFPEIDGQAPVIHLQYAFGGSAANMAVACAKLGMKAGFVGRVGADNIGKDMLGNFKAFDIDTSGVIVDADLPSGQVFIAVEKSTRKGQKIMYAYPGAPQVLSGADINRASGVLERSTVVHMASLRTVEPFEMVARLAKSGSGDFITSFNPGTMISNLGYEGIKDVLDGVDILILSRNELESIFGFAGVENNVAACFSKTPARVLAVTFGARGSNYFTRSYSSTIVPIFTVPTVNTTGAGDAFCAGFMATFLPAFKEWIGNEGVHGTNREAFDAFMEAEGKKPDAFRECLRFSNAVSSFVVQSDGAQDNLPAREQVEALLKSTGD